MGANRNYSIVRSVEEKVMENVEFVHRVSEVNGGLERRTDVHERILQEA